MSNVSLLFLFGLVFTTLSALAGTWSPLSIPQYADTEVQTNVAMQAWSPDKWNVRFQLTFNATPSNNVEVAFGTDTNQDGILAAEEARLILGLDCGLWKLHNVLDGLVLTEESITNHRKTLSFAMRLTEEGAPQSLSITDGSNHLFEAISAPQPPSWAFDTQWNRMSLSARGLDRPNEQFEVEMSVEGFILFLR